ncbi:MAG: BatA protein [Candidatus Woesearchaeota archaeon]|nr:MAG: BatA protein [Candidatus Woesearchaeota archaeon]
MYLTFDNPEYLWYLFSIPVLIVSHYAFLKYSRRRAIRFANFEALKKVTNQSIMTKNNTILLIRMVILFFLILAIAGTKLWYEGYTNENDFVIAIDTSSSMSSADLKPNRLDASKAYAKEFTNRIGLDSQIGLISFSGASFVERVPTRNKEFVKSAIDNIDFAHVGGTNIPDALVTGTNLLLSSEKGRTLILLSDGSNTASYFIKDPIGEGIKYAQNNNVKVYTIGVGSDTGPIGYLPEYYNISAVYDENTLLRIANETGGKYYDAKNNDQLRAAFDDIAAASNEAFISIDLGPGLLIITLALLFLEWGLISTRFRALP